MYIAIIVLESYVPALHNYNNDIVILIFIFTYASQDEGVIIIITGTCA